MTNYIDDEWNELKKKSLNQQYWLKFHKKKNQRCQKSSQLQCPPISVEHSILVTRDFHLMLCSNIISIYSNF